MLQDCSMMLCLQVSWWYQPNLLSVRNNNLFLAECWKRNLLASLLTMQIYLQSVRNNNIFLTKHWKRSLAAALLDAVLPAQLNECEEQQRQLEEEPICSTSSYVDDKALEIIKKIKSKCEHQKKKIKRLNEKVRRQTKKMADFKL